MEAIRTQYKGITFKSKSEAQFAFLLDNSHMGITGWKYEPEEIILDNGYIPDFLIFIRTRIIIIEYKPKEPTKEYYNNFICNANLIQSKNQLEINTSLIFGNIYDGCFYEYRSPKNHIKVESITNKHMQLARNYRFDLK